VINQIDKISLANLPTPIIELHRLSDHLGGPRILMKRDDLTGLAFGGNKTRKLEYLLNDALREKCDTLITAGAQQSNHCRQTAAAAAHLGLDCHLLLGGEQPNDFHGNLLLNRLLGANLHWAGEHRKGEDVPELFAQLKSQRKTPYIVPYGGSNALGAMGYANAIDELESQIDTSKISHMVFASSSGGTHAGLLIGRAMHNKEYSILGINIDKDPVGGMPLLDYILNLTNQGLRMLRSEHQFQQFDVELNHDYIGDGYGKVGESERAAIQLLAELEGILLDPVYTGRAMAGLIDMVQGGSFSKDDTVLFWHTGGAPALFCQDYL